MERSNLICCLVGWFSAKRPGCSADDLRILVDQALQDSHMVPIGGEPNDKQLLEELLGEITIHVLGTGLNRSTRRRLGDR